MVPFAVTAFITLFFIPSISTSYVSGSRFAYTVSEQDYHEHLSFQSSFSMRRLGNHDTAFNVYKFGDDGLVTVDAAYSAKPVLNLQEFPPFPLQHLMDFFYNVNNSEVMNDTRNRVNVTDYLSLLVLLLLVIPGFFIKGKTGCRHKDIIDFKKIAGKRLRKDVFWRKKLPGNEKNIQNLRKDA